jgi:hydrogenase/urease accessory protein HupE
MIPRGGWIRVAGLATLLATAAVRVAAHPLATTTVSLAPGDRGTVDIAIAAEADPLIAKLEALALAGIADSSIEATREGRQARLIDLSQTLISHIDLRADGISMIPVLSAVSVDETGQAEIRLIATLPSSTVRLKADTTSATTLTWRSTFVFGSYPLAVRTMDGHEVVEWLQGPQASSPIALGNGPTPSFARGAVMGFTHIVPFGLDHILFVLGLFLLSRRAPEVLVQVTAFTVAHSVTLGLSLYGLVSVSPSVVEPLIALSVAYVGVENLMTTQLRAWRVALVFAFGLLHGMGFAEALAGLHLSASSFVTTLVSFNVGVEAGQLAVIACAAAVLTLIVRVRAAAEVHAARFASAAIGLAGVFWTIERLI